MTHELGDRPRIQNTFAVNGTNTNPSAAVLIVKLPDGTKQSYLSASGFSDQGSWNADTNTPTLANGTGTVGHYYSVSVAGSIDFGDGAQVFAVGDYVVYDGESWLLLPAPQTDNLSSDETGVFYYDFPLHQKGIYTFRFEGFGTVHAADETSIRVVKSEIR